MGGGHLLSIAESTHYFPRAPMEEWDSREGKYNCVSVELSKDSKLVKSQSFLN